MIRDLWEEYLQRVSKVLPERYRHLVAGGHAIWVILAITAAQLVLYGSIALLA
jgi:hypothetical protein